MVKWFGATLPNQKSVQTTVRKQCFHDWTMQHEKVPHRDQNFGNFVAVHLDDELRIIECMEIYAIRVFQDLKGCRNVNKGGESMRTKEKIPRSPAPYMLYAVSERADCAVPIGC